MSYNPNIPNLGDFTSISQKQMLANFQSINSTYLIDHVALTAVDHVGKHNSLTLRPQSTDPTTEVDQCAIYNKLVSSVPQLFFRSSSNATPIQLSNSNLNTFQTGSLASNQSTFLAGPFTIYMGYILNCPNAQLVTLLPACTLKYVGLTTVLSNDGTLFIPPVGFGTTAAAVNIVNNEFNVSYNITQFTVIINKIPTLLRPIIYYMAIGQ